MAVLVTSEPCRLARPYLGGQSFLTITIIRPKGIMPGIVGARGAKRGGALEGAASRAGQRLPGLTVPSPSFNPG